MNKSNVLLFAKHSRNSETCYDNKSLIKIQLK